MDIEILASSSTGNCYRVGDGNTSLLLDCGIRFKDLQRLLNFNIAGIGGILVTHEHGDHAKAVKDLIRTGASVYMSQGTRDALGADGAIVVRGNEQFKIGSWTVIAFKVEHDAAEPVGYLLGNGMDKLVYLTDTFYCRYKFSGLTHIMVECNFAADILQQNVDAGIVSVEMKNRLLRSHFSLENVMAFLWANDLSMVKEIHLIHLSDTNGDEKRFQRDIAALTGKPVYVAKK